MTVIKVIVGALLVGIAQNTQSDFAPILFVQGMIIVNFALYDLKKKKEMQRML